MSRPKILFYVTLDRNKHNLLDEKTLPYCYNNDRGGMLPSPVALSITQYDNDTGFYLFQLDRNGIEQSDTYHDTLQQAFEQAEYWFNVKKEEWKKMNE